MPNDGFRSGPDHVGLFELFPTGDSDNSKFRREAFHMLGFFLEKALRNQQREVYVLMAGSLETGVEFALQHFPHGVAIRPDNHAAFDDFGRLRHVPPEHDILIPGGKVFLTGRDRRFGHRG